MSNCMELSMVAKSYTTNLGWLKPYLVGGIPIPLKNDGVKVSWDDDIPNIWKVIQNSCSKPPSPAINNGITSVFN